MKSTMIVLLLCLFLSFNGFIMAEKKSNEWFKFNDPETNLLAEFPIAPISMEFELSEKNISSEVKLKCHTLPQNEGCFFINTYKSSLLDPSFLHEKTLKSFFKNTLLPYLFYHSEEIKEDLKIKITPEENDDHKVSIEGNYKQEGIEHKLLGKAFITNKTLYFYFYVAPETEFDSKLTHHFLDSVKSVRLER